MVEESKAWQKEFWETHDVITTPTYEFISWVRSKQKAMDVEEMKAVVREEFDRLYELYIRKAGCNSEYSRTVAPFQMDAITILKDAILKAMGE